MEIFISWSGEPSKEVALTLRDWLPLVIQEIEPFVSSEDLDKGKKWLIDLSERLEACSEGIVCVTQENQASAWLNYEAGALAKATSEASLRTVLLDLSPVDVVGPLANFQHTSLNARKDVFKLLESINKKCQRPLRDDILKATFEREWSNLVSRLDSIRAQPSHERAPRPRTTEDMLEEILVRLRDLERVRPSRSEREIADIAAAREYARRSNEKRHGIDSDGMVVADISRVDDVHRNGIFVLHRDWGKGRLIPPVGDVPEEHVTVDFKGVGRKVVSISSIEPL